VVLSSTGGIIRESYSADVGLIKCVVFCGLFFGFIFGLALYFGIPNQIEADSIPDMNCNKLKDYIIHQGKFKSTAKEVYEWKCEK